jgi:valyl-tRNA synthetase
LGIYIQKKNEVEELAKQIPFQNIVLHGLVNDPLGKKMSKSKANVVNPMEIVDEYGADSIRFALVYGTALGNDQILSYPKLEAMKKFSNKLWNMARFIEMSKDSVGEGEIHKNDKKWLEKVSELTKNVTRQIEAYQFNYAAEALYEFIWHEFADKYIEDVKTRLTKDSSKTLNDLFQVQLKLLHPFMPFITEEIYTRLYSGEGNLIISQWPQTHEV